MINEPSGLDLTPMLSQPMLITAGEQTFTISTDLPPTLLFDIQQWWGRVRTRTPGGDDTELNEEAGQLVAKVLGITPEGARALGGSAQIRLLDFLGTFPYRKLTTKS